MCFWYCPKCYETQFRSRNSNVYTCKLVTCHWDKLPYKCFKCDPNSQKSYQMEKNVNLLIDLFEDPFSNELD